MAEEKKEKGHEVCLHRITLLEARVSALEGHPGNKRKRNLQTSHYIQYGGSLSVAEARRHEEEQQRELERGGELRLRRPPKCSECGVIGHKRNQCSRE